MKNRHFAVLISLLMLALCPFTTLRADITDTITLGWTHPAPATVTNFLVFVVNPDNSETLVATVPATQFQATVSGLTSAAYTFVVRAQNIRGLSDASEAWVLPAKPAAPQNVNAIVP